MYDDEFNPADPALSQDPARDAELGRWLREDRLRERIAVAARRQLMRRVPTPWYGWVARYDRAIISIGVAAALIAAVVLNRSVRNEAELAAQSIPAAATDLRGAVAGGSRSAITDAVVGPDATEFLIALAVDR